MLGLVLVTLDVLLQFSSLMDKVSTNVDIADQQK